ncbi:MAG: sigma-70 family RNA polymerase sigma factor [Acidimicrobiia bacterium]|nr:sigma-70 family RNA polymerase sigma factor [Acidimicrobiia bacterium]
MPAETRSWDLARQAEKEQEYMHDSNERADRFSTTEWSLVLAAGDSQAPDSREALASLFQTYWYPIYAHVRQLGERPDRAQDLTQGFFTHLLEDRALSVATPDKGRFRSFLKGVLRHYLSHEWRRERTQKRGGGQPPLALDFLQAESEYKLEPADDQTPERAFEQRWARTLLARVFEQLRGQMAGATGLVRFRRLEPFLTGQPGGESLKQVAAELEMSESAVKVTLHRMRRRFGELLRKEVARTVNEPGEVDREIRYLFEMLGQ